MLIMVLLPFQQFYNVKAEVIARKVFTDEKENYEIIVEETSAYNDKFVMQVTIKNKGTNTIRNWNISASMDGIISNIWNAEIIEQKKGKSIFAYQKYNRNIAAGEQVVFGMQIEDGNFDSCTDFELIQEEQNISDTGEVSYEIKNSWNQSAILEATIHNTTNSVVRDWKLVFTFPGKIDNIWNAEILKQEGNRYVIGNKEYNADIAAGESVVFGFQVSYDDESVGTVPAESELYFAEDAQRSECPGGEKADWYKTLINADNPVVTAAKEQVHDVVKVALLDSGVDYTGTIDVNERIDFIGESEEEIPLWDDLSGHGTGVAGLIVSNANQKDEAEETEEETDEIADDVDFSYLTNNDVVEEEETQEEISDEEETIEDSGGEVSAEEPEADFDEEVQEDSDESSLSEISEDSEEEESQFYQLNNKYGEIDGLHQKIDLISLRVLDEKNEAPVSRVITAVQWAMDNDVNIIHMSWGTTADDPELHEIIEKAYKKGILIVAPAGNEEEILYPAKYEEVMAVGSVNSRAELAEDSACGKEMEVVAPGEDIIAYTSFGILARQSGTSFAAPQVTALAAILWQQDITRSNRFIRQLIAQSATDLGDSDCYGYGLINYKKAVENYDVFARVFQEDETQEQNEAGMLLETESNSDIDTVSVVEENYVKGLWVNHENMINYSVDALNQGIQWPDSSDSGLQGKSSHPKFHGGSDYVGAYLKLMKKAKQYWNTGKWKWGTSAMERSLKKSYEKCYVDKKGTIGTEKTDGAVKLSKNSDNKKIRKAAALFTMGVALHTLGDTYAHKSYGLLEKNGYYKNIALKELPLKYSNIMHGPKMSQVDTTYKEKILGENQYQDSNKTNERFYFDNRADCKEIAKKRYTYTVAVYQQILANKVNKSQKKEKMPAPQDFICKGISGVTGGLSLDSRKKNILNHFGIKGLRNYLKQNGLNVDNSKYKERLNALDLGEVTRSFNDWKLIKITIPSKISVENINVYKVTDEKNNQVKKTVIKPERLDNNGKKYGFIGDVGAVYIISVKGKENNETVYATVKTKAIKQNSKQTLKEKSKKNYVTVTNVYSGKKYNTKNIKSKCTQISLFGTSTIKLKKEKFNHRIICGGRVQEIVSVKNNKIEKTDAIKNAEITLSYYGNNITYEKTVKTDEHGKYLFDGDKKLIPGVYKIKVAKNGYKTVEGRIIIYSTDVKKNNKEILMVKEGSQKGGATGQITDAKKGKWVGGLELLVMLGINNNAGSVIAKTTVKEDGTYELMGLPAGNYTVKILDNRNVDEHERYLEGSMNIIIVGDEIIENQNGVVSNQLDSNQIRIVLTWGETPRDLDSHLLGTTADGMREHMYFSHKQVKNSQGIVEFMLDVDDVTGYGPETTTIYDPTDDSYQYYVYNYSRNHPKGLMNSGAMVQVYKGDYNLPWQTFYVPEGEGYYWNVFHYDAEREILTPYDEILYDQPEEDEL